MVATASRHISSMALAILTALSENPAVPHKAAKWKNGQRPRRIDLKVGMDI